MLAKFNHLGAETLLMQTLKNIFGRRLKEELSKRGWTLSYFASRVGTSHSSVSLWTRGESAPHLEMLEKIGEVLEIDPYRLIKPDEKPLESKDVYIDDAVVKVLKALGYLPPKNLKRIDKS